MRSPDDRFELTVTGPKESLGAWVTLVQRGYPAPGFPFRVWPIEGSVDVLWRPDSRAFALTDYRYANNTYVLVLGTDFRMGESGPGLGVRMVDLTPVVRKAFEKRARKYYGTHPYDTLAFYARVERWIGNDRLLVLAGATTQGPAAVFRNNGVRLWSVGYLVDVPNKAVLQELSDAQLLSQYGIKASP